MDIYMDICISNWIYPNFLLYIHGYIHCTDISMDISVTDISMLAISMDISMDISFLDISINGCIFGYIRYIHLYPKKIYLFVDISKKIYLFVDIVQMDIVGYIQHGYIHKRYIQYGYIHKRYIHYGYIHERYIHYGYIQYDVWYMDISTKNIYPIPIWTTMFQLLHFMFLRHIFDVYTKNLEVSLHMSSQTLNCLICKNFYINKC